MLKARSKRDDGSVVQTEDRTLVPRSHFKRHVATHQEQLAIFVVPKSGEDADQAAPITDRDDTGNNPAVTIPEDAAPVKPKEVSGDDLGHKMEYKTLRDNLVNSPGGMENNDYKLSELPTNSSSSRPHSGVHRNDNFVNIAPRPVRPAVTYVPQNRRIFTDAWDNRSNPSRRAPPETSAPEPERSNPQQPSQADINEEEEEEEEIRYIQEQFTVRRGGGQ